MCCCICDCCYRCYFQSKRLKAYLCGLVACIIISNNRVSCTAICLEASLCHAICICYRYSVAIYEYPVSIYTTDQINCLEVDCYISICINHRICDRHSRSININLCILRSSITLTARLADCPRFHCHITQSVQCKCITLSGKTIL